MWQRRRTVLPDLDSTLSAQSLSDYFTENIDKLQELFSSSAAALAALLMEPASFLGHPLSQFTLVTEEGLIRLIKTLKKMYSSTAGPIPTHQQKLIIE